MKIDNSKLNYIGYGILIPEQSLKVLVLIVITFSLYGCASLNSTNYEARIRAVNKITDQNILYKVALLDINDDVRLVAFNKITDQNMINKIIFDIDKLDDDRKEPKIILAAVNKITDQNVLYKIALLNIYYKIKIEAFNKITDQNLINTMVFNSHDPILLSEVLKKITDQDILYKVALEDGLSDIGIEAMYKLNPGNLSKLASESKVTSLKLRVVGILNDQTELMNIAQYNDDWQVRKAAFKKLNDSSLDILTREAKDPSFALSAKIRLGRISWKEAFYGAETLNRVIGAAAIVDTPQPLSGDVIQACHNFIRLGDASRIPELIYLLNQFGDKYLAEDYMNCGESTLEDAGCKWGRNHGYNCTTGYGSNRVRWGSK